MTKTDEVLIQKFDAIIEDSFENPAFSIENACVEIGISRSQLHRILKKQFKLSTSLYIRKKKLHKAKELLADNNLKIADVSSKVGIDSPQNFSKYFISEFGVSPTEFRKRQYDNDDMHTVIFKDSDNATPVLPKKQGKYLYYLIGIILMTTLIIYILLKASDQSKSDLADADLNENSIAILPFENLGDSTNAYFSEGITDQIRSSLASASEFKVISTFSSNEYLNSRESINHIANALTVRYVLQGDVLQNDSLLNINVRLYNGKDNQVIWTKQYSGNTKEIFDFMNQTSKSIADELNNKLNNQLAHQLRKAPQTNLPAYREYLQGQELLHHRNKEKLDAAIVKFNKAIEFDPNLSEAYAEKANAYFLLADGAYADIDASIASAEKNAQTATRLDYTNAVAYAVLGNIYRDQHKWRESNEAYSTALKYDPNNAMINYWYSLLLRTTGSLDKAILYSTKAINLDPLHPVISAGHIINCVYGKKAELAEKSVSDGELLFNEIWSYHWSRGIYYMEKKDYSSAFLDFNKASALNPKVRVIKNTLVYCQVKLGQRKEVEDYLKSLPDIPRNHIIKAMIYVALDDKEQALNYLEKSEQIGSIPSDMKVLPHLNILQGNKRFEGILQKFGLGGPIIYPQ